MSNKYSDIRLTDELERQLIQQAIADEQFRFQGVALKKFVAKVGSMFKFTNTRPHVASESAA
ncbi:MAG TPA: hypothetical protein VIP51_00145 [Eoetvoesiella sp.]